MLVKEYSSYLAGRCGCVLAISLVAFGRNVLTLVCLTIEFGGFLIGKLDSIPIDSTKCCRLNFIYRDLGLDQA